MSATLQVEWSKRIFLETRDLSDEDYALLDAEFLKRFKSPDCIERADGFRCFTTVNAGHGADLLTAYMKGLIGGFLLARNIPFKLTEEGSPHR